MFAAYVLGYIKTMSISLTANGFSAAARIVAYGAMSVAWKRQMDATFVQSAKVYLCNHFLILCLIQL